MTRWLSPLDARRLHNPHDELCICEECMRALPPMWELIGPEEMKVRERLNAGTEPCRDDRHPMEQISDAVNEAVRTGKLVEVDEQKPRALPRTKRGEGIPGLTWEEQQERKLSAEREKIKNDLLLWARQEVARHITITRDFQAVEQGRADHWLLPHLRRLEIPVQPE